MTVYMNEKTLCSLTCTLQGGCKYLLLGDSLLHTQLRGGGGKGERWGGRGREKERGEEEDEVKQERSMYSEYKPKKIAFNTVNTVILSFTYERYS